MPESIAYYNERDPFAAAWLVELIKEGVIADGVVDDRDIQDVRADELAGYTQCHFFAGIGGWSYALRLAGWPDNRPVWTGSCPCQPFSTAGSRKGIADERHLWPAFYWLIDQCHPAIVFGEQVESKAGRLWLAGVRSDLEVLDYAVGCADLCAASVSAPHGRPRLYWVAYSKKYRCGETASITLQRNGTKRSQIQSQSPHDGQLSGGFERLDTDHHGMVNSNGYHQHWWSGPLQVGRNCCEAEIERGGRRYRAQWRIKPGLPIVAHGIPNRVGKLCGYGNAIVPQVAQAFIESYIEATNIIR